MPTATLPELRAIAFTYDQSSPQPPTASAEAIQVLAKVRGKLAIDELESAITTLSAVVRRSHAELTAGDDPKAALARIEDARSRWTVYTARAASLARILKLRPTTYPALPEVPALARILVERLNQDVRGHLATATNRARAAADQADAYLRDLESIGGDAYARAGDGEVHYIKARGEAEEITGRIKSMLERLTGHVPVTLGMNELETHARNLSFELNRIPTSSRINQRWPQDGYLSKLDAAMANSKALASRLAALECDRSRTSVVVADRVQAAVNAAGGVDPVVEGILCSRVLLGITPTALEPANRRLLDLQSDLGKVTSDFDKLALAVGDTFSPPAAESLRARQAILTQSVTSARSELMAGHRRLATELVSQAMAGGEEARETIAQLASRYSEAFPDGFGRAMAAARFEAVVAAELATALATN